MTKPQKPPVKERATSHPETTKHVKPGVADDASSKATSKTPDARNGQDKDGNEQHPKTAAR